MTSDPDAAVSDASAAIVRPAKKADTGSRAGKGSAAASKKRQAETDTAEAPERKRKKASSKKLTFDDTVGGDDLKTYSSVRWVFEDQDPVVTDGPIEVGGSTRDIDAFVQAAPKKRKPAPAAREAIVSDEDDGDVTDDDDHSLSSEPIVKKVVVPKIKKESSAAAAPPESPTASSDDDGPEPSEASVAQDQGADEGGPVDMDQE